MKKHSKNLYLHADGDGFFVACELTHKPELKGRPVIVGGDRGIAVALSEEAKKLGVTRGMPTFQIKKFYPEVVILSHHFDLYRDIAGRMYQILLSYFSHVEEYSIDECFALVEPSEVKYFGGEKKLLTELKREVEATLGVTYSLGLGRTKALAKLASKLEKPGGLVILLNKQDEVKALKETSIDDIWGIGWKTYPKLEKLGIKNAYDFANYPEEKLRKIFSRTILDLQRELRGEEILEVNFDQDPRDQKSIQSTATFRPASTNKKIVWRELAENAEHACRNARELGLVAGKISFFVKTSEFRYFFGEAKPKSYTSDPGTVLDLIEAIFSKIIPKSKRIRSTGVILHDLIRQEKVPLDLFGSQEKDFKKIAIEEVADKIRAKYGESAIRRGASLRRE